MCSRFFPTKQRRTVPAYCRYVDVAKHLSYSTDLTMSLSPTDISPLSPDDSMRRRRHQQLHMVHVRRTCCIHTCCIEHASTPPPSLHAEFSPIRSRPLALSFPSFLPTVSFFFFSRRFSDNGAASKISREERSIERKREGREEGRELRQR